MPQHFRHGGPELTTYAYAETLLGEIRYANLRGRLYPDPPSPAKRWALQVLRSAGWAEFVEPTECCTGGWFARARSSTTMPVCKLLRI